MVIVELAGGLANQMVIYSAARALAEKHKTLLKLDLSALKRDQLRRYELYHLNISAEVATTEEIIAVKRHSSIIWIEKLQNKIQKIFKIRNPHVYVEPECGYDPNFWELGTDIYLKGFFISRKYFQPIEQILRREFQITSSLSEETEQYAARLCSESSVSIHVRRGDYSSNVNTRNFHGLLPLDYYHQAMKLMEAKVISPSYYVFSDDIHWVRQNLHSSRPLVFIEHTSSENSYEDLYLMSKCRHNIIANSGFSYWGAWLNEHREKVVIAPMQWFANKAYNNSFDLLPPEWIKI